MASRCSLVLSLLLSSLPSVAQEPRLLEFADIARAISWQGPVPVVRWAADGRHVELERGGETVWLDPATGQLEPRPAAPGEAAAEEPARDAGRKRVLVRGGDLWLEDAASGNSAGGRGRASGPAREPAPGAQQLTRDGTAAGAKELPALAGDGRAASFVRGNDLHVVAVDTGDVWQVTTDGGPKLFHGKLDWVYQEELYGRGNFEGHWWSPAGGRLAFLSLDETAVRDFTIVDHVPEGHLDRERAVVAEITSYPKAGDPNPTAKLSVAHLDGRRVVPVDLSAFPADLLVVRVDWTPDGSTLLATVQDRIQTWAELCAIDPATGAASRWIREESPTWVNRPAPPRWLADGSFLWLSERTGYQHVYHYRPGGELVRAVTAGDWQVRSIERVDEAAGLMWFEGTRDGATGRHLYRIGLDGKGLVLLTPGIGTHQFVLRTDGAFLIDRWSALDQPTVVRVLDGATGATRHEIGAATTGDAARYAPAPLRRLSIPARDGYQLDASLQLPPDWREGRRYPVFLPTYSGPNAPSVRDRYAPSTWHTFLAHQGFLVLQVNVRSASGRGHVHTGACYRQLGVTELNDLEDAVDHVVAQFGGDPGRVAISGWSYGGFMAAYALTHSRKFALGLAGAGVYDWRLYDTIYTERYMRTPQENAAGYDATSVIKAAKQLHGQLVIVHGAMDDNVHLQNAMQLLWELQVAGVQDVELMVYPRSRHGLNSRVSAHHQEFQWRRLRRLL